MIKRLGKNWTKLHRLTYVIVVLGLIHFFMAVKLDWREPLLYASVAAAFLGWRIVESRRRTAANA
jgi:sulfoxide reductase heme-binding subunit YedZ